MDSIKEANKPHAVCVPFPAQGHINPMLKLAKLLHHKGFHITFVNTEYNHNRLLKSRGPDSLDGLSSFRFETIPDGLPLSDADSTQDVPSLCVSTRDTCLTPFRKLLLKLNGSPETSPPVSCVVSDGIMSFTLDATKELGIPNALFWTTSACGFMGYVQYPNLIEKGLVPLKDESDLTNGYLDTVIDFIPGMEDMRLKDMPTFIRTTDPNFVMIDFPIREIEKAQNASAIILNTFDALEGNVLRALSSMFPPIYTIGPLHLSLNEIQECDTKSIESNLWKDEPECLEWLDLHKPGSVVYINFGSVTVMTPQQLVEFAWGLSNSNHPFLWVIRPDLVAGDAAILPTELVEDTKERGLMVSWCPQEQVLGHRSIGGFLTHNGWNSTLESLSYGVPMLCWPYFAEQQTNCRYCCHEWRVGMEIENDVKKDEVEKLVRELMDGKKGNKMRENGMEWKILAQEAIHSPHGSSYVNLEQLVTKILLSK